MSDLSASTARRIVLEAQGLMDPRPEGRIDIRHVRKVLRRLRAIQIDSVNVVVRSHFMPLYSRLGPYRMELLDELAYRRREAFEYWGHVASYLPADFVPLLRHRMDAIEPWPRLRKVMDDYPGYIDGVLEEVRRRGPVTVADLEDPGERSGPWWGHSRGKTALEWLFDKGLLGVKGRRNFARVYDLFENTVPPALADAEPVPPEEAQRRLVLEAAAALGVATEPELGDFFRFRAPHTKAAVAGLAGDGALVEVEVEGWTRPGYVLPGVRPPRRPPRARTLLTPFDSLVWYRPRTERIFGFDYRIEIYVPEAKRQYGYYVFPFLLGDALAARVDLKADRSGGVLAVKGAWGERGIDPAAVANELAAELTSLAGWLDLGDVRVGRRGDLATLTRRALG